MELVGKGNLTAKFAKTTQGSQSIISRRLQYSINGKELDVFHASFAATLRLCGKKITARGAKNVCTDYSFLVIFAVYVNFSVFSVDMRG